MCIIVQFGVTLFENRVFLTEVQVHILYCYVKGGWN